MTRTTAVPPCSPPPPRPSALAPRRPRPRRPGSRPAPVGPAFVKAFSGHVAVDASGNAVALWRPRTARTPDPGLQPAGRRHWGPPSRCRRRGAAAVFPEIVLAGRRHRDRGLVPVDRGASFGLQSATRAPGRLERGRGHLGRQRGLRPGRAGAAPRRGSDRRVAALGRVVVRVRVRPRHRAGPGAHPVNISAPATTDSGRPALGVDAAGTRHRRVDARTTARTTSSRPVPGARTARGARASRFADGPGRDLPQRRRRPGGRGTAVWARFDEHPLHRAVEHPRGTRRPHGPARSTCPATSSR